MEIDSEKNNSESKLNQAPQTINPIKPVIRRSRNILRVDHLISRRGIATLPEILGQTKFKGKGHELEDLKLLLFKTKHWAHRLFPGLTFEDFVAKTEHLGNKRTVKNFLNRIRTNQPLNLDQDREYVHSDGSDDETNKDLNKDVQNNEDPSVLKYDLLFKDHIDEMNKKVAEERLTNTDLTKELNDNATHEGQLDNYFNEGEFQDDDFEQDLLEQGEDFFHPNFSVENDGQTNNDGQSLLTNDYIDTNNDV